MSIRALSQKIGMLRSCLPYAFKKRIDSRTPMEVSLSSMFSKKKQEQSEQIRNFSHLVQIRRNLVSVSRLDDDSIDYHFGDGKCEIHFNKEWVGLAFRQDKLYLLSLSENVNVVSSKNENSSSCGNGTKKRKRIDAISSKLWHCRLSHISRGRIERLVQASILPPLEFSDLEQCIDSIKEKYVKNIKKGAKRSAEILEIIHTYICESFPSLLWLHLSNKRAIRSVG